VAVNREQLRGCDIQERRNWLAELPEWTHAQSGWSPRKRRAVELRNALAGCAGLGAGKGGDLEALGKEVGSHGTGFPGPSIVERKEIVIGVSYNSCCALKPVMALGCPVREETIPTPWITLGDARPEAVECVRKVTRGVNDFAGGTTASLGIGLFSCRRAYSIEGVGQG
jgi:hypothetical protein